MPSIALPKQSRARSPRRRSQLTAIVIRGLMVAVLVGCPGLPLSGTGSASHRAVAQLPPGARSPGGVRTGIFGLEAKGNRFVYVFDRSASMGQPEGAPLAAAKEELIRSIDELGDVQQFYLIFYNERLQVFSPPGTRGRLLFATEENRRSARRFIQGVRADGGTRHAEPLAAAFRLNPDVIFLLTDADAKDDLSEAELERLARLAGGARCMVVQFGAEEQRSLRLAELAARCGGKYLAVSPTAAMDDLMEADAP